MHSQHCTVFDHDIIRRHVQCGQCIFTAADCTAKYCTPRQNRNIASQFIITSELNIAAFNDDIFPGSYGRIGQIYAINRRIGTYPFTFRTIASIKIASQQFYAAIIGSNRNVLSSSTNDNILGTL